MATLQAGRDLVIDHDSEAGNAGLNTTSDKGIQITAPRNITVDHGSEVSGSAIQLTTGATGAFTLSQGSKVGSAGPVATGVVTISADDMVLDSASSSAITAASAGSVRLQQAGVTARPIDLGGGASGGALNLSDSELGVVTAGILFIGRADNPGNIAVTAPITVHTGYSTLSLFAGGGITEATGGSLAVSNLAVRAAGSVALNQGNDVTQALAAAVSGAGQGFALGQGSAHPLVLGSVDGLTGIATSDGAVSLITAASNLQIAKLINAGSAPVALTAGGTDSLLSITAVVNNAGVNPITLAADRMDLQATITNISTGRVTLQPASAGRPIDLGSTLDPTGKLSLSNNELNAIQTGGVLQVGSAAAGSLLVSTTIFPASVQTLALATGSGITQSSGAVIAAPQLAIRAGDVVTLDQGNNIGQAMAAAVTGVGKGLTFTQGFVTKLAVGAVDGLTGITTNGGALVVSTAASDLVVSSAINAGSAQVTLTAGGADALLTASAAINNSGVNSINLTADRMDLQAAIANSNTGRVILLSVTSGRPIDLGSTTDPTGKLSLSNNELKEIQTGGVLQIGNGSAGNIVVSATISPTSILALQTGGGVTQASAANITAPELAVRSTNAVVLDQGNVIAQALAASVTGSGQNFTFTQGSSTALTIGTVDGLVGITAGSGAIALAGPSINLAANVTSKGNQTYTGPVTLAANVALASSGSGNIAFSSTIQSPKTAFTLNVTTGGVTTFTGAVGGNSNPLGGLTIGSTGSTQINGGSVNTGSAAQTYGNTVTFGAMPATLTGVVSFTGNLILGSAAAAATGALQVTGSLVFSKTTTLTSTFAGTALSQFGHIVVTGATTFTGAMLSLNYQNFTPAPQSSFDVVGNSATPTGQFANAASPGPVNLNGTPYAVTYAGGANSNKDFVLTTDAGPVFTSPNVTIFTVNSPGTFTVTVTGFPVPTLKMTGTLPKGVTFNTNTGVLSGTSTAFGFFPITITATNAVAAVTQNFTLAVSGIPAGATTPNQRFVSQVYIDLLGRVVDTAGLAAWINQLNLGVSRSQVVYSIETSPSNEFRTIEVQQLYQKYLGRSADTGGLAHNVALLSGGGTIEQVAASLGGSNEFYLRSGTTDTGFLQALYQIALQRAIDPMALAFDSAGLANGTLNRQQIALVVVTSMEANQLLVEQAYSNFLHRAPDPQGLAFYAQSLAMGLTYEQLVASVMGSAEFFSNDVGP
jgi:hypothetical protein